MCRTVLLAHDLGVRGMRMIASPADSARRESIFGSKDTDMYHIVAYKENHSGYVLYGTGGSCPSHYVFLVELCFRLASVVSDSRRTSL